VTKACCIKLNEYFNYLFISEDLTHHLERMNNSKSMENKKQNLQGVLKYKIFKLPTQNVGILFKTPFSQVVDQTKKLLFFILPHVNE